MPEGTMTVNTQQDIQGMLRDYQEKNPGKTVKTVYKYCRTCEGRKFASVTLDIEGVRATQILPCPHCMGRGTHMWGFIMEGVDPLNVQFVAGGNGDE